MKTLDSTPRKVKELKSYSICFHNLRTAKYALNLASKYSKNSCGAMSAYKFNSLKEAEKCGDKFLQSNFQGIFAHKEFMKQFLNN